MTSDELIETLRAFSRLSSSPISPSPDFMGEVADALAAAQAEIERLREALTPSGDTKAAYMGEVECDCPTQEWRHHVPWTSIKEIMSMIRARAALGKEET